MDTQPSGVVPLKVEWDESRGTLAIEAETPAWAGREASRLSFEGPVGLSLDADGDVVAVNLPDAPELLARVVPRALRPEVAEPRTAEGVPWLLDVESRWVWVPCRDAPEQRRISGTGRVEAFLVGEHLTVVRLEIELLSVSEASPQRAPMPKATSDKRAKRAPE